MPLTCEMWDVRWDVVIKVGRRCVVVQSFSHVQFFVTPWTAEPQASLSFIISRTLLKLMSIESVMPSNRLILCSLLLLLPLNFPRIRVFSNELALRIQLLFVSGGQRIAASASASVLPMNSQGWFLLGLTCLISLLSQGHWGVFSSKTVWNHQFFVFSFLYDPTLTFIHDYWKNYRSDYKDLCQQSDVSAF